MPCVLSHELALVVDDGHPEHVVRPLGFRHGFAHTSHTHRYSWFAFAAEDCTAMEKRIEGPLFLHVDKTLGHAKLLQCGL